MPSIVRTVEPAAEPIPLDVAKAHLRIEDLDEHDDLIKQILIPSARRDVESIIRRALITQTWQRRLDQFPRWRWMPLPYPPLQSVTSIEYVDDDEDNPETWSTDYYDVDTNSIPGRVIPSYGQTFPTARGHYNDVVITYKAGYGDSASSVPADIRHAMLLLIADGYNQPENTQIVAGGERDIVQIPKAAQLLLSPYILPAF